MVESQNLVLALTTERNRECAESLAKELLQRRLVACVSLVPIHSFYFWDGQLQRDLEVQLMLKTSPCCLSALREAVLQLHSYDTPEWITWPVKASPAYGDWLQEELRTDELSPAASDQRESEHPAG